ncbi:MAG: ADP-ribosylation factor-like protein [Methanobacteriota archaeon]
MIRVPPAAPLFGIPHLDRLLGEVPETASVALANDPGVSAEPFLESAVRERLAHGAPVVYATFQRAPSSVRKSLEARFGPDASRVLLLDAFSALLGTREEVAFRVTDPTDLAAVARELEHAATQHPKALLLIDSLSTLADHAGIDEYLRNHARLHAAIRRFPASISVFTRWPYGTALDRALDAFDAVVGLRGIEERLLFGHYYSLERARWTSGSDHRPVLYKLSGNGEVLTYVPKIVVTGPHNAGKSTFVHAVSDLAVSVDRKGTTVALDHGHLTLDGLTTDVFGTPGESRFDPIIRTIAGQALGVLVVVDASDPSSFPRAKELLEMTWRRGIPGIVVANKQDVPGALPPEEVARRVGVPEHARVVGCVGRDREAARQVLRELLTAIVPGEVVR